MLNCRLSFTLNGDYILSIFQFVRDSYPLYPSTRAFSTKYRCFFSSLAK